MIQKIIQYPTVTSKEFDANVRHFDDTLKSLIQDLKDTIEANSLKALSAFQIGSPLAVIIVKQEDGSFLEIINPIIVKREGKVHPLETTAYFPNLSATTTRYEKVKIMYEDINQKQQFLQTDGEFSILIQRKIDYLLGSNFRIRLDDKEQKLFDSKLEYGTDALNNDNCPTTFKRDKILAVIKFSFILSIIGIIVSFFIADSQLPLIASIENYLMLTIVVLLVIYFFYAQYEGKQYKNCSSCQIGNIVGVVIIHLTKLIVLFIANYFIF